jgi:NAD(P)H-hydrate epimerase
MQNKKSFITSRDMRALEVNAEYLGISLLQLMELAGHNVAHQVQTRFTKDKKIAIFCGLGGNGGDGFVVARHLLAAGFDVTVVLIGRSRDIAHDAALKNWIILQSLQDNATFFEVTDSSAIPEIKADIIIDALLGTGTKGKIKPPIAQVVDYINGLEAFKVAVDVPTGIDSDTGDVLGSANKSKVKVNIIKQKQNR